jgi:hypothetical protein
VPTPMPSAVLSSLPLTAPVLAFALTTYQTVQRLFTTRYHPLPCWAHGCRGYY